MTYNETEWTSDDQTKAGISSTTTSSLTTGTLIANTLQLSENVIKASDGGSTITLDTSDNVIIAGGLTATGATQLNNTLTVGEDGTGYDVKFYGDIASNYMLWDQSEDRLEIRNTYAKAGLLLSNTHDGDANSPAINYYRNSTSADAGDVLGITTYTGRNDANDADVIYGRLQSYILDATKGGEEGRFSIGVITNGTFRQEALQLSGQSGTVDAAIGYGAASTTTVRGDLAITGGNITTATTFDSTVTVGSSGSGIDVKFWGATAANYMLWDASVNNFNIVTTHNNTALRIQSNATRSTADAPDIEIKKNSVPNDNDYLGSIKWLSLDAGGSTGRTYGEIDCFVRDADDNAADGSVIINTLSHGAVTQGFKIRSTNNGSSAEVECVVSNGPLTLGVNTSVQGRLIMKRKDVDEFPYIEMVSADGTSSFLFVDNDGKLRIHDDVPTLTGDGVVVGAQTA